MFKYYVNSLRINFILTRKIFLLLLLFFGISFFIQIYLDNDTSISSFTKGLVLSSLILNISLIIFGFKQEEESNFAYISNNFDLSNKHRIIIKYLFFLLLNSLLIIIYFIFNYKILLLAFIINTSLSAILLFIYYKFGVRYLGIVALIISAITIMYLQNLVAIPYNFSTNLYIVNIYAVIFYLISLIFNLLLNIRKDDTK